MMSWFRAIAVDDLAISISAKTIIPHYYIVIIQDIFLSLIHSTFNHRKEVDNLLFLIFLRLIIPILTVCKLFCFVFLTINPKLNIKDRHMLPRTFLRPFNGLWFSEIFLNVAVTVYSKFRDLFRILRILPSLTSYHLQMTFEMI